MKNKKGFTLMEVLLAAMIVGVMGLALAALTTAAMRESSIGRTRVTLRNQISDAMRFFHQDLAHAKVVTFPGPGDGFLLRISGVSGSSDHKDALGPKELMTREAEYTYDAAGRAIKRDFSVVSLAEGITTVHKTSWLFNVKKVTGPDGVVWPSFTPVFDEGDTKDVASRIRIRLILETTGTPSVSETIDEIILAPNGFAVNYDN
jgi:prepilin-type N-terminal cleavage/methylation domain-containing protein